MYMYIIMMKNIHDRIRQNTKISTIQLIILNTNMHDCSGVSECFFINSFCFTVYSVCLRIWECIEFLTFGCFSFSTEMGEDRREDN